MTVLKIVFQRRHVFPSKEQAAEIKVVKEKLSRYRETFKSSATYRELQEKAANIKVFPCF
jgi:hypothetical protein